MKKADDAIYLDTTNLDIEEVVNEIVNIIEKNKMKGKINLIEKIFKD